MIKSQKQLENVLRALKTLGKEKKEKSHFDVGSYINSKHPMEGISTPNLRNFVKNYSFDECAPKTNKRLSLELEYWDFIFKESKHFDAMSCAIYFLQENKKEIPKELGWSKSKTWVSFVENWVHSDNLSSVFQFYFREKVPGVRDQLVAWNLARDSSDWKKRVSLVALMALSKKESYPDLPICLELLDNCLKNPDYYLQKAVGWSLRQMHSCHPKEAEAYLMKNISEISSTAFTTAIEKFKPGHKDRIKEIRKNEPKQNKTVKIVKKNSLEETPSKNLNNILTS